MGGEDGLELSELLSRVPIFVCAVLSFGGEGLGEERNVRGMINDAYALALPFMAIYKKTLCL